MTTDEKLLAVQESPEMKKAVTLLYEVFKDCDLKVFIRFWYKIDDKNYEITFMPLQAPEEKPLTMPDGWMNWNELSISDMADHLEKRFMVDSSGDAKCILEMVRFYRENIRKSQEEKPLPEIKKGMWIFSRTKKGSSTS